MFKADGLRRKLRAVILAGEQQRARGICRDTRYGRRVEGRGAGQNAMGGFRNLPRCNLAGEAYSYLAGFNIVRVVHVALVAATLSSPRFLAA